MFSSATLITDLLGGPLFSSMLHTGGDVHRCVNKSASVATGVTIVDYQGRHDLRADEARP